jgi:hypothetical protein
VTAAATIDYVLSSPLGVGLLSLGIGTGLVLMGLTCLIGARRRWRWLVDPPKETWFWNSQAFLKAILGTRGLRVWTYVFGGLCVLCGAANIAGGALALISHAR